MGCVSSHILNQEQDLTQISHHIVSLTSTTYGLLTLDPSPTPRLTLGSILNTPLTEPITEPITEPTPEVINSLELMAGLDPTPEPSPLVLKKPHKFQEYSDPDHKNRIFSIPGSQKRVLLNGFQENVDPDDKNRIFNKPGSQKRVTLDGFQENVNTDDKDWVFIKPGSCKRVGFQENVTPDDKDRVFIKSGSCKRVGFEEDWSPDNKSRVFIKPESQKRVLLDGSQENVNPDAKDRNFIKTGFYEPVLLDGVQENLNPDNKNRVCIKPGSYKVVLLDGFEELCPPKGENRVVIYTTTLRGVRKTFEACNSLRAVLEGFGVAFCERDISMDRGFKKELWELMKGKDKNELVPPRVFVKGRYVGGLDEVLRIVEEGCLGKLLEGLPKAKVGYVCDICGGARFLPCGICNGSCKLVVVLKKRMDGKQLGESVLVKCRDCNENGLVCCPLCS